MCETTISISIGECRLAGRKGQISVPGNIELGVYMETHKFLDIECHFGVRMKARSTFIEKWPTRLEGAPGSQEEFDSLLAAGGTGTERYVE